VIYTLSTYPAPSSLPQREDLRIKHGYYALWRRPGVVADFLRTLSVQPFYVSFIDLVLFLPRPPLEPFSPYLPQPSRPRDSPPPLGRHPVSGCKSGG